MSFDTLVLSLPTRDSTVRMRVWRALKETGCGVLRDGVYVLPASAAARSALEAMESEIRAAGGFALAATLQPRTDSQAAEMSKLFDRSAEYGALVRKIKAAKTTLPGLGARRAVTAVRRLERAFEKLSEIDFFPAQAKLQAADALAALKRSYEEAYASGEPRVSRKGLRRADTARYQKRVWATRREPWVDRLASAWLIKRFIDRDAKFAWLDRPRDRAAKAVGFDFDGAEFTHIGNRVTFEVLVASFGLDRDAALASIGAAVHFLDVGGIPVDDAKGLETLLHGAREKSRSDDALLAEAMRIFDLFHRAYSRERAGAPA
ncbi:MAG TPA: chromate resistance protein ChrB domain-containing protein [Usitatibacter sp.]